MILEKHIFILKINYVKYATHYSNNCDNLLQSFFEKQYLLISLAVVNQTL